jgi:membrane protein
MNMDNRGATAGRVVSWLTGVKDRFYGLLWGTDLAASSPLRQRLIRSARLVYAVGRDLADGQLTLRAMSLVYTTLLSLVPLLALSFSVLKAFGVHNQVRPALLAFLAPLGTKGAQITEQVIGFIDNIRVGVLGAVGLGMLIYTVTALLQKIELSFNFVWRVKRARPLAQRFSQYLSVLTIGPVLVFSAIGITASFMSSTVVQSLLAIEPFGTLIDVVGHLVPYLLVIAAFALIYLLMPNTRVRLGSALVGALVAGVLWQSLGWGFATFVTASTQYTAIYAGFAIVIVSMIWLYLNWLIVLIGASLAYYHQNPGQLASRRREPRLSARVREKLALLLVALIGRHYCRGESPWTAEMLAARLAMPVNAVEPMLQLLLEHGILAETAAEPPAYLPARALESLPVTALLDIVRGADEDGGIGFAGLAHEPEVESMLGRFDAAVRASLADRTLRDLVGTGAAGSGDEGRAGR